MTSNSSPKYFATRSSAQQLSIIHHDPWTQLPNGTEEELMTAEETSDTDKIDIDRQPMNVVSIETSPTEFSIFNWRWFILRLSRRDGAVGLDKTRANSEWETIWRRDTEVWFS